jgi:hypothetical protein
MQELLLEGAPRFEHQAALLETPPAPLFISPPYEGWMVITGARPWGLELRTAAERLSQACHTTAISCEIFGNCYRLRLSAYRNGQPDRHLCTPQDGWQEQSATTSIAMAQKKAAALADTAEMPLYDDAEQLAYETLLALEVPVPLMLMGTQPFGSAAKAALEVGPGTTLKPTAEGAAIPRDSLPLFLPAPCPSAAADAPVLPTSVGQDFGLTLFEDRYVEGRPGPASLERLLQIEAALLARAQRAAPGAKVSLTLCYHAGIDQPRLEAMLRAKERPTLAATGDAPCRPWWAFWREWTKAR